MSCVGRLCKDYLYLYNFLPLIPTPPLIMAVNIGEAVGCPLPSKPPWPWLSEYMWNWDTCPLAYVSLMTKLPSLPTSSRTNVPISCLLTVFWYPFSKVSKHIHQCESLAGAFYEHCELSRKVPLATQLLIPTTTEHPWKPSARPLNQPDPGHQQPLSLSQFDTKAGSLGLGCWGKSWRNSLLHFKTKRLPVALSVRENYY